MSQLKILAGVLATLFTCSAVAAAPVLDQSGFYVVVPLGPMRAGLVAAGIEVTLGQTSLPPGLVGIPYGGYDFKQQLNVTGDPAYTGYGVKWSVEAGGLPEGLSLNADGTISGTPTANGSSSFKVRATYKTKTGENEFQVFVGQIVVELAAGDPPQAIAGQFYSYDIKPLLNISGDDSYAGAGTGVTWTVVSSTLPAGVVLRTDGTISGTPTVGGSGMVIARASYRGSNGEQTYQMLALAIKVSLATAAPPQALVGQAYLYDLKNLLSIEGDSAYTGAGVSWSVVADTLPAGLTLRGNGTIAGTPTAAGTGAIKARATYRGVNGDQTYQVVSLDINVLLAAATPPQAIAGQAYSFDLKNLLTVTGDNAYTGSAVTWTYDADTLPAGLGLTASGIIAGTPTAPGSGAITARATYRNVSGKQTYQVVTLNIAVSLAASTPPQGIVGQVYSFDLKSRLAVTGDSAYTGAGVTWSVVSGTLPEGLSLRANGTIAGTPVKAGAGSLKARATYRGVNGEQTYQVVTLDVKVALGAGAPPQAILGQAYSYNLQPLLAVTGDSAYTGSGVTWTAVSSTLPDGLQLGANGTITGTPIAAGAGSLVARATYRGEKGEQTYQVVALNISVSLAAGAPPQAIVGQAYNYDLKPQLSISGDSAYTGAGVTWTVVSSSLPAGLVLRADGTIGGTPTASGTGSLTARAAYRGVNGQQAYQVVTLGINVSLEEASPPQAIRGQAYSYSLKPHLSVSGDSAYSGSAVTWTVVANTLPEGLTLRSDGTIAGTPVASGTGRVTARATYRGVSGDQAYQVVVLNVTVALAATTPPQAIVGQAYNYDLKPHLSVSGDNAYVGTGVTWSTVSSQLPAGLTLRSDGTISGVPTASGSGAITVRATYRAVDGQQTYQIVSLNVVVALAAGSAPQAIVGQAYSYDLKPWLSVSGDGAYTGAGVIWTTVTSSLPAGITLRADGTIGGTPTAAGTGTVTARATYRGSNGQQSYQIVTLSISVTLAPAAPPQAIVGQAYSYNLKPHLGVTGDSAYTGSGVTWSTVSSTLASGLTLAPDGTIRGTPTAGGNGSITARATYRGVNGEQTYQVVTLNVTVVLGAASPPQAIVGQAYNYDLKPLLSVSGDNAYNSSGVTWTAVSSTLPAGLQLRSDGTIGGTPTASGTGTLTARATYRAVNGQQTFEVVALGITVTLGAGSPPQAIVGQAYSYDIKPLLSVSGDSAYNGSGISWTMVSNTLAPGLQLLNSGVISGTPTAGGTGTLTARATFRGVTGDRAYQVVTLNISVALDAATLPQARVGEPYTYDVKPRLSVTGDPAYTGAGVTWSSVGSTLPAGLSLTGAGTIAGTPGVPGTGAVTARATYRNVSSQQSYSITALPAWTYGWTQNGWSTPAACGSTTSTRAVWCLRDDGTTVADANCVGTKPAATQAATNYSTCSFAWSSGTWNTPAACGSTTSTRSVTCVRSDGATVADASCTTAKPTTTTATTDYAGCSYTWNSSGWATPSACGAVTQQRTVWCQRSDGTTVTDASCGGTKPTTSNSTTNYSSCSYSFSYGSYGACSTSCGGGTQSRSATCYRSDGTAVAQSSCGTPTTTQSCNTQSCYSYSWTSGGWSAPNGCGTVTQTRSVSCQRSDGAAMSDAYCGGAKPATTQSGTSYASCSYSFSYGSYGACSASCGGGTQSRSATCYRSDGTGVAQSNCGTPTTTKSCNTQACYSYYWNYSAWSAPAGCGTVTQTRSVSCQRSDGAAMSDSYCGGGKPATTQSGTSYASCGYNFSYGGWSGCSASCGGGTQTRSATCYRTDGQVVSNSSCGNAVTTQSCNTQACAPVYSYGWSYGGWGGCSVSCGGGTQSRGAACVRSDGANVDWSYCGGSPYVTASCNTQACAPAPAPTYRWSGPGAMAGCGSGRPSSSSVTGGVCYSPGAQTLSQQSFGGCPQSGGGQGNMGYVHTCQ